MLKLESLRAHFGTMTTIATHKVMPRLDRHSRAFIALSPFLVLATTDGDGGVDASPCGDAPGVVATLQPLRVDSGCSRRGHPTAALGRQVTFKLPHC